MTSQRPQTQLGFDDLLGQAHSENQRRMFERETAHVPNTLDDALPFYLDLLKQHVRR